MPPYIGLFQLWQRVTEQQKQEQREPPAPVNPTKEQFAAVDETAGIES